MTTYGQYRRLGAIPPIKGEGIPDIIVCLDTETFESYDVENNVVEFPFRLGVMAIVRLDENGKEKSRKYERFDEQEMFLTVLLEIGRKNKEVYIFCHNWAFDLRVLDFFNLVNEYDNISKPPIINERMFIYRIQIEGKRFTFIDTANYAVTTVRALGEDLGFPKLTVDFHNVDTEDLYIYCQRDVDILIKFMLTYINFIKVNDLGYFCPTLASQSLVAYRHRFMPRAIFIHKDDNATKLERQGYLGGRVEVFRKGDFSGETFYALDVNSMYPYCMLNSVVPYKLRGYNERTSVQQLERVSSKLYVIADCHILTSNNNYPCKRNGRLIFPIGQFRCTLQGQELIDALDNGVVIHVYSYAAYDSDYIFKDYVDFFYNEKVKATDEGNKSWRFISKIFLNSLYGKFGQTNANTKLIGSCDDNLIFRHTVVDAETGIHKQEIYWLGKVYQEWKDGEATYSFPAIAGAVTSASRYVLRSFMDKAGKNNVFYMDTDSLIVNQEGYTRLLPDLDNNKLGSLKLENTSNDLIINGAKDYYFHGITKLKGIKSDAIYDDKTRKHRQLQFNSMIAWMNSGGSGGATGKYTHKGRTGIYTKGEDLQNGFIVPFTLDEPLED